MSSSSPACAPRSTLFGAAPGRAPVLSVNLSRPLLLDPRPEALLAAAGPLEGLILEVTENSLLEDTPGHARAHLGVDRTRGALRDRRHGCGLLRAAPAHHRAPQLPQARSVADAAASTTDADRGALVSAMLGYARQTGGHLVAEGVETEAELETLAQLGVELVQGFYLARPGPPWPPVTALPAGTGVAAATPAAAAL